MPSTGTWTEPENSPGGNAIEPYRGRTTVTRCPSRTSALGSAPEMSASPPVLTKGPISGVTNATCRLSDKAIAPLSRRRPQASTRAGCFSATLPPCPADSDSTSSARTRSRISCAVIAPAAGDVFLEIGPGTGALTLPLAERCARVVAVEIDEALARRLRAARPCERRDRDAGRPGGRPARPRPSGRPPGGQPPLLHLEPAPAALPRRCTTTCATCTSCCRRKWPAASRRLPARRSTGSSRCCTPSGRTPTSRPAFRPAASLPLPGSPRPSCAPGSATTPRAEVGDLGGLRAIPPEGLRPPTQNP